MLSTFELISYAFLVAATPLILFSVVTGASPQTGPLARYYGADRLLLPVGNVFVLVLCLMAVIKLATHSAISARRAQSRSCPICRPRS